MSSFITRFLANMTTKDPKPAPAPAPEARPRRHERSSRHHEHHHHRSRHDYHRSSYIEDSDEDTDDEPLSENSLMLDLGPDYSPKAMSSISFPSPPPQSTILFETDDMDLGLSAQHIEQHRSPAATAAVAKPKRKPVQYYDAPAAHAEVNFRQQRGRSSSRSSTASQDRDQHTPSAAAARPRGW
ncbi:hypothetical protein BDV93DRAFT_519209 [Ceratobasidium sp. AG-I]|nr:hypothetical protein BDV93DRAFT_519209 [Ceratobasidium sp. AG-I]